MQYFQTISRLDAPEHDRMLVHKRLDIYLREQFLGTGATPEMTDIPELVPTYSFHLIPQTPERSVIMLRSATPMNLPGEKAFNINLAAGDVMDINVLLCAHSSKARRHKDIVYDPSYIDNHIQKRLAMAGFEPVSADPRSMLIGSPKRYLMKKVRNARGKAFSLYGYQLSGKVKVIDHELAAAHFISGIGQKNAYGFGMIMNRERN